MSLADDEYMINVMPGYGLTGAKPIGQLSPEMGSYTVKTGTKFTIAAVGINGGYFLYWRVHDYSLYIQRENPELTWEEQHEMSLNGRRVYDNPLVLNCSGVDITKYNETARTWWINAEFDKAV